MTRAARGGCWPASAALLVACGGDSDCTSPPAFEGEPVGECDERLERAAGLPT